MKKILLLISFFIFSNFCQGQLIISQVYEGVGNNNWIEITNTGLNDIDLSFPIQYKVGIWQQVGSTGNGMIIGSPTNYINLSGILTKGQKYLIKNTNAATNVPHAVMPTANDANTTVASFDGNDALAIFTDSSTIADSFGVGINYSQLSYSRNWGVVASKAVFTSSEWTAEALSTISGYSVYYVGYIGTHKFSGSFITLSNDLSSVTKEYGSPSTISSFTVTRTSSSYFLPIDLGPTPPPPPGITPPTYLIPPVDFELSLSSDFTTTIGTSTSPLMIDSGNSQFTKTVYFRLGTNATVGNKSGLVLFTFNIPNSSSSDFYFPTNPINPVTAKPITISGITANDKVYDGNTATTLSGTPVLEGVLTNDIANVILSDSPTANFNDAFAGTDKPVTVSGYTISGSAAFNYALQQPAGLTASILPSGLLSQTISFTTLPTNLIYGDSSINLQATASTGLPVVFTSSNPNIISISGSTATIVGAGEVTITASQQGNAEYEAAIDVNQTLTILPKTLSVSGLTANDKVYDGTTVANVSGGTLSGIINSDDVSFTTTASFSDANAAANKSVSVNYSLNGQHASNYWLQNNTMTASITPKEVSIIGISIDNKPYDGTNSATISGIANLSELITNDLFTVTIAGNPTATFNDASLGMNKPITVVGYELQGMQAGNYSLLQPSTLTANIVAKTITISGLIINDKVYDRSLTATISGIPILNGIIASELSSVELTGTLVATFDTFNVGTNKTVTITGGVLSGVASGNYTIAPLTSTASITKKPLTIANAIANDKAYDGNTTASITGVLEGVIAPDVVNLNLTGTYNDAAIGTNKPVTSTSTIVGTNASNYILVQPTGLNSSIYDNPCAISSGYVSWNGTSVAKSNATFFGAVISDLSRGNNNGNTALIATANPSNYAGASGTSNFNAASFVGALNTQTSTYFQFTITPNNAISIALTGIDFGSRSNTNGPKAFSIRSSVDNYATSIASGTLTANSTWVMNSMTITPIATNSVVTYRIYGYNGTGSNSVVTNWRIDDLKVYLTPTSSSALSSVTALSTCSNSTFDYVATTPYINASISWTRAAVDGISNAAITTNQTANPSEILVNTTNAPVDVVYHFMVNSGSCSLSQSVVVTVNPLQTWYYDSDGDGFGNALVSQISCSQPANYVSDGTDCDDSIYSLTNNCNTLLNLKLFVQGYYTGQNQMNSLRTNPNNATQTYVDDVTVELRDAVTLELIDTKVTPLYPDGSAQCAFSSALNGVYYISVKGSNSVKTWSAAPIAFGTATVDYDFSDAVNKAFGDNMIEVSSGVWALISGDINSDGNVDNADFSSWETDANEFAFGVYVTDLNGDGNVDNADFSIWEANANNFVFSISPTP